MLERVALCDVDGLQEGVVPEGAALDGEAVHPGVAPLHREFSGRRFNRKFLS